MRRLRLAILALTTLGGSACGADADLPRIPTDTEPGPGSGGPTPLVAADLTPGYFRDTYRMLDAQALLDDATAQSRLEAELAHRVESLGDVPTLTPIGSAMLSALVVFDLRATQATGDRPRTSRDLGETLLRHSLGLDPALLAFNEGGGTAEILSPGAASFAGLARAALETAADGYPALCSRPLMASTFDPGPQVTAWVEERCEPDRFVGGYCEPDRYVEGDCYEEWVPENCSGGEYVDRGWYEYRCDSDNYCRNVWRPHYVWVDGDCTDGYYDRWCESGHYEEGLCYDGTYVPGYCIPGHYEYRYPGGTWTYANYATAPAECDAARPAQSAIVTSAISTTVALLTDGMDPLALSQANAWLADGPLTGDDEARFDAALQILDNLTALLDGTAEPTE